MEGEEKEKRENLTLRRALWTQTSCTDLQSMFKWTGHLSPTVPAELVLVLTEDMSRGLPSTSPYLLDFIYIT